MNPFPKYEIGDANEVLRCKTCNVFHEKRTLVIREVLAELGTFDPGEKLSPTRLLVAGYCKTCAPDIAKAVARDLGFRVIHYEYDPGQWCEVVT